MKFVVAFTSPKRSEKTVRLAALQAKALDAELVLLRILADPEKVGVVAQLIASDRPFNRASEQVDLLVEKLKEEGIKASGLVKVGEVAKGIIEAVKELNADVLYLGASPIEAKQFFTLGTDPIARYMFDHCPVSVCFVRGDLDIGSAGSELIDKIVEDSEPESTGQALSKLDGVIDDNCEFK